VPESTTSVTTLPTRAVDSADRPRGEKMAGENFPVALRILPRHLRGHLVALYDYARYVDDLGDEPAAVATDDSRQARLAALAQLADEVRSLYAGAAPHRPVLARLAPTVRACQLPVGPLLRLIEANRRDQLVTRYHSYSDLVDYCRFSADPVGELVLYVFGAYTPYRAALSARICTALQVVEHLQDVAEDYRRGRVYLPAEDLAAYRVTEAGLAAQRAEPGLRAVVRLQARRAAAGLRAGAPLLAELRGWSRLAVAGYLAGGRAALAALASSGYDPLPGPPRPSRAGTAARWFALVAGAPLRLTPAGSRVDRRTGVGAG
jgi:squalene synthase HpnC